MDPTFQNDLDAVGLADQAVVRRFTDELTGATALERQTQAAQLESDEEEEDENRQRLKLLYEDPSQTRSS
jgi:hypothetical protein